MSNDYFEFHEGGAQTDIQPGTYTVTLSAISEPRTIVPQSGPSAGKEIQLRDWTFATDEWEFTDSASTKSSTKSKAYRWVSAFLGAPAAGQRFRISDLIGREAIATIVLNEGGWPKVDSLSAKPAPRKAAQAAPPAARPADDDLPF